MRIDDDLKARIYYGCRTLSKFKATSYDDAIVLQRFETPTDPSLSPKCEESPMRYMGDKFVSFILSVPKPVTPVCTGTVIIQRFSKNRYKAAFENGKSVFIETFSTIKAILTFAEDFFS